MRYFSAATRAIRSYLKQYPKTLAIRGVALVCLVGYFFVFPAAEPTGLVVALSVALSYVLTKTCRYFDIEFRGYNRFETFCRLTFFGPYAVFEIIWNLLSSASEVDEL